MLLFTEVAVFDGEGILPGHRNVLVDGDRIVDLQADPARHEATWIDGRGATLLPGLIDAHTHLWAEHATTQSAIFGVTTALDMFSPPELNPLWRTGLPGMGPVANTKTAGFPATVPGGHGTEYGIGTPAITDADAFVTARLRDGADYIKIICDSVRGTAYSLSPEIVRALVDAAHEHGVLALAHATVARDAATALDAGVDALMHVPVDDMADLAPSVLVPTLATLRSGFFRDGPDVLTDPALRGLIDVDAADNLRQTWRIPPHWRYEQVRANVRHAHERGCRVLAGTDAGMPGTAHGVSLHHELGLLVEAGLSPVDALAAATSAPADVFGLTDRGRIAPGLRADLLLVNGDPTEQITDSRRIRGVWIGGEPVRHDNWRTHVHDRVAELANRPQHPTGPIGVADWRPSTGGESTAELTVTDDELTVRTSVMAARGFHFGYAGAVFATTRSDVDGVNLTGASTIEVTVRADRPTALLVSLDAGYPLKQPPTVPIAVTTDYQRHRIPLAEFGQVDLSRVRAVRLAVVEPDSAGFQVAIAAIA
ncbi:MAG TPA: amidohydrolase family protein [Pseudonocardiaceae bacterium]